MNDALVVGGTEGVTDVRDQLASLAHAERATAAEPVSQVLSTERLHRHYDGAVAQHTEVEQLHNARVVSRRRCERLEARAHCR